MEQSLLTVTLQLTVIIVTARVFATLFKSAGQPGVCGEMAAGLLLGPSLFGKFFPCAFHSVLTLQSHIPSPFSVRSGLSCYCS